MPPEGNEIRQVRHAGEPGQVDNDLPMVNRKTLVQGCESTDKDTDSGDYLNVADADCTLPKAVSTTDSN